MGAGSFCCAGFFAQAAAAFFFCVFCVRRLRTVLRMLLLAGELACKGECIRVQGQGVILAPQGNKQWDIEPFGELPCMPLCCAFEGQGALQTKALRTKNQ